MTKTIDKLFVYGTMKNRHVRGHLMDDASLMGEFATALPIFRMYHTGYSCGVALCPRNGNHIQGDLFRGVSPELFTELDEAQGVERGLYTRIRILIGPYEAPEQAYMYIIADPELLRSMDDMKPESDGYAWRGA